MPPKVAVIIFPGTNCNIETKKAIETVGLQSDQVWYEDVKKAKDIAKYQAIVLPGGFSFGDYLRAGKLSSLFPVMEIVKERSEDGTPILGICNGFQILCESGILPGAFLMNISTKFTCKWIDIKVVDNETPFTYMMEKDEVLKLPVAHKHGNYFFSEPAPTVVFRYLDNPNGSKDDIAGICTKRKNVVGLMPHPERACHKSLGSEDGLKIFASLKKWLSHR